MFFNNDEFATDAIVDGKKMKVVIDNEFIKEQQQKDGGEGLENEELLFHAKITDFEEVPFFGKTMNFNHTDYKVVNIREDEGVYIIMLGGALSYR